MRIVETVEVARPPAEVVELLTHPERQPSGAGWSRVARTADGYEGTLEARSGPITVTFDCRFSVVESAPGERVRVQAVGVSPRLGFTLDAELAVRGENATTRVQATADVCASGPLAGLGQRELAHQARRLLASVLAA